MMKKMLTVLVGLAFAALVSIGLAGTATAQQTSGQAIADQTAVPMTGTLSDRSGALWAPSTCSSSPPKTGC